MPNADAFLAPVLDREGAVAFRESLRARDKIVVFTNGCFDVVHDGHTQYLAWARAQGDALIVGLNGDGSVRGLKGPERPFVPFAGRAGVLAALRSVDAVVGFDESTPVDLLAALKPDVHVKSAQYRIEELPERYVVESNGGRIVLAPHLHGKSTTDLVASIRSRS
jgi:rfaE bifunctional protein nucleotidyltransferase chain/domain